jgi:hypothetical protein
MVREISGQSVVVRIGRPGDAEAIHQNLLVRREERGDCGTAVRPMDEQEIADCTREDGPTRARRHATGVF